MRPGAHAQARPRSRIGATLWLLATILAPGLGLSAGLQVQPEPSGPGYGDASLTPKPRLAQPSVLPRGLPRWAEGETQRQKATRTAGSGDGKPVATIAEPAPQPPVPREASAPLLPSRVPWSAPVRAFEPRGPPRPIA
jgi:hypothetical protein